MEICNAIGRLQSMEEYQRIRFDAVEFYCDRFLCSELMSLIDESLSIEQLAELNPNVVKVAFIMLLRDMMQSHRHKIVTEPEEQSWDTQRIEQFIVALFFESQAPMQPYQDWLEVVKSEEEEPSAMLLAGLAKQLGVNRNMLFVYQMSTIDVIAEDVLS